ncbi:MAG TPA: class I SAM-dependent methyltransferase [Candidatus Anoxymicrobiaceae bacterium]
MNRSQFNRLIREYRASMETLTPRNAWMDWRSDVYVNGTWQCVKIADRYLPPGARILDFGCGMGLVATLLSRDGYKVTGIDIDVGNQPFEAEDSYKYTWGSYQDEINNPSMIKDCWADLHTAFGADFSVYDGRHIPFDDGSFDGVVAHAVLEHLDPTWLYSLLEEIHRVCAPRGHFLVFRTPRPQAYLERLAAWLGLPVHDATYTEDTVIDVVQGYGFRLVESDVTDMVPSFPPVGLRAYNVLSPVLVGLDSLLLRSPLRKYAHHMALTFQRLD